MSWWRAFWEWWWNCRCQNHTISSVFPEAVSLCREKYWHMITLTAIISLLLNILFMKNSKNREVQFYLCSRACFWWLCFGSLGGLWCWLRTRCADECTNHHVWNHQHYNHYTYHQSESSETRELFFFFFFSEGISFLSYCSIYFKTWTHVYNLWTISCLFCVPVFIHLSLGVLAWLTCHPRTWQQSQKT